MNKLDNFIKAGEKPTLSAVIHGENIKELGTRAKKEGADILEIRLDKFKQLNQPFLQKSLREIKKLGMPIIATARCINEGGEKKIEEKEKLHLLQSIFPYINAVDIELKSSSIIDEIASQGQELKKIIIVSYHNLKETPIKKELGEIVREAKDKGADIVKIAAFANAPGDVTRLMDFTCHSSVGPIASISMGEIGTISRIIAPLFGSCLSYAYMDQSVASGQLNVSVLVNEWRKYNIKYFQKNTSIT